MPLSEHVYCVAVPFQMTEWVEQRICIKFCVKLEYSSVDSLDDSEGHSYRQLEIGSFIKTKRPLPHLISNRAFWWNNRITQVTQPCYSPDLAPWDFKLFPQLKSPLKGKRFQTVDKIQEITTGKLMVNGRAVWVPKVPTLKGTEVSLSYVQCFLYLLQ